VLDQFRSLDYEQKKRDYPDLVLDAGNLPGCNPSTVVDLSESKPKILRKGPVSKDNLLNILNKI